MQSSYTKNYIQTYIWKTISFLVGFFSLFVVIPFLSSNKELYGIYTFCASFQLYLSYADIGFLSAGQKYAAECYAREDREGEMKIFGFVGFILLCLFLPFSLLLCVAANNPHLVVNGLSDENLSVVRGLILTIAIVSPLQVLLQRVTQSILTIRVKDYVSSRIDILGNIIKILSVFFFFSEGKYMIFEYFLFINLITIICNLITIFIIKKTEKYSFMALLKNVRWSRPIFSKMKKLAFSSLGSTVSWLICYELDLILIGNLFTVVEVAHYSICLSILDFIRNISNILYGPYSQRFNHFIALRDDASLKSMMVILIRNTYPLYFFGCCLMSSISYYFIMLWVGKPYMESVPLMAVLAFFFFFQYVNQIGGYIAIAKENYSVINIKSTFLPVIFLSLIFVLRAMGMGIMSFVTAKIAAAIALGIYMWIYVGTEISMWSTIKGYLSVVIISTTIMCLLMRQLCSMLFPDPDKNSMGLAVLLLLCLIAFLIYTLLVYGSNKEMRMIVKKRMST